MKKYIIPLTAIITLCHELNGANFEVEDGETVTTTQVLSDSGDRGIIREGGEITTTDENAVNMINDDQVLSNRGIIETNGDNSLGVYQTGANSLLNNKGSINTDGSNSNGITSASAATGTKIYNSGSITTSGLFGLGISSSADETLIVNRGSILTENFQAHGITSAGSNTTIKNSGSIEVLGMFSNAFYSNGDDLNFINSGTIKAAYSFALNFHGLNPTLTLKPGSNLQGGVGTVEALNLNVEKGLNLDLLLGYGTFGDLDIENPYIIAYDGLADQYRIITLDRAGFTLQADFLADLSDGILETLPSCDSNLDCFCDSSNNGLWVTTIGSYRKRKANHKHVKYTNRQAGIVAGYNRTFCAGDAGFFGGVIFGKNSVAKSIQKGNTATYAGGFNYSKQCDNSCWMTALSGGLINWKSDRLIMNNQATDGKEKGRCRTHSAFISAETGITTSLCFMSCCPQLNLLVRYAGLFLGDYHEKSASAPVKVHDRHINLLTTKAVLSFFDINIPVCDANFSPYFGVFLRNQISGNSVKAEILDDSFSFHQGSSASLQAILFGIKSDYRKGHFELEADFDTRNSLRVSGEAGVRF